MLRKLLYPSLNGIVRYSPIRQITTVPSPAFALRPYQEECISTCLDALKSGLSRIAVSLATGGGKTVIFSNLIPRLPVNPITQGNKVLILVHRKELAQQAAATISKFYPNYKVEIDMAEQKASHTADITIASVQTLTRSSRKRLENYNPQDYKAIIVDECHHAVSQSYISIFKYFDSLEAEDNSDAPGVPILGFSATLKRHDKIPLGKVFEKVVYNKDLLDMIQENWLVDVSITPVYASIGLQDVPLTKSGDYDLACLGNYVNTPQVNELVLKTYLKHKQQHKFKSALFFCVNVDHLKQLSHLFRLNGINCQYVTGETKKSVREALVTEFKEGKLDVLMNCGVFTEGTDIPNIDSVFIVRPTKSRPLLIQMIGRGLRLHSDKQKCHVVDFVDIRETGIELNPTLAGRSGPVPGLGLVDQQQQRRTISSLGAEEEIKSVEYTTYDSIHDFLGEVKASREPDHIIIKKHELPWIRVGRKSWAIPLDFSNYLRLDINKSKQYELKKYFQTGYKYSVPAVMVKKSLNLEEVLEHATQYHSSKAKPVNISSLMSLRTDRQAEYLNTKFMSAIENSKVNPAEFRKLLDTTLSKMTKTVASELIFGYSVGGKYCLQEYVKEKMLPKKVIDKNAKLLL